MKDSGLKEMELLDITWRSEVLARERMALWREPAVSGCVALYIAMEAGSLPVNCLRLHNIL